MNFWEHLAQYPQLWKNFKMFYFEYVISLIEGGKNGLWLYNNEIGFQCT